MQSLDDIKIIRFDIVGSIRLDMERVVEDPIWNMASGDLDVSTPEGLNAAILRYFRHYIAQETLMQEVPSTCGPADIYTVNARIHERRKREAGAEPQTSN